MSVVQSGHQVVKSALRPVPILGSLLVALALSMPARAAEIGYKIQPVLKVGDTAAGIRITSPLHLGTLNDKGQMVFRAGNQALLAYSEGTFTPLAVGGQEAPGGRWPALPDPDRLACMNQRGDIVFTGLITVTGQKTSWGYFLWDATIRKLSAVALPGMPSVSNLTFLPVGGSTLLGPALNNGDDIALGGYVADAAGKPQVGAFFLGRDHALRLVLLPDQALPGGGTLSRVGGYLAVTDAGAVAFRARRAGESTFSAYQWENGVLTPLALVGADAPGGGKITGVSAVRLNNLDRTALLALQVSTAPSKAGLFRFASGQLQPVAVPGQAMPGGGQLQAILQEYSSSLDANANGDVSRANEAGQYLFRAALGDGTRALYRLDPDGKLELVLKQGTVTELGEITHLLGGRGIGFNSQGQIALLLRIAGGPETLYLLTPTTLIPGG